MDNDREHAARRFAEAAEQLRAAADHLDISAGHFRDDQVPRGCAHAFAAEGHIASAADLIKENAVLHSTKAQT